MNTEALFDELRSLAERPEPFGVYTSPLLWNDPHISARMLEAHLDPSNDWASFPAERIDRCVAWMTSRFGIGPGTRICDFGCGPGLWTTRFASSGADVTGIDLSERSIEYAEQTARAAGLAVRYTLGDYLEFATDDRFDLVTMIHGDFSVLSPDQRARMLDTFRTVLADGGSVLLDVASMAQFRCADETPLTCRWLPEGGFFSGASHHQLTCSYKYPELGLLADRHTVVEARRRFEIVTWNQCYTAESLAGLLEAHGLEVAETYADVAGSPLGDDSMRIAVVATKRT